MGISFDNTLGALFVGYSVSATLYGIFAVQVFIYCRRYPMDKVGYKAVVAFLFLLETMHQVFIGHAVYSYSITNFLNVLALYGKPIWSLVFQLLIGAVVGTIVKFFFTLRVWRFSHGNVWLTTGLLFLTFGQLGVASAYTYQSYTLPALPDIVNLRVLGIVALSTGVVTDICIAAALCYYLQAMRNSYTESKSVITTLMIYAVNTGLLTSAMSLATLIIYNFMPENLIFVGCYFVLSTLYAVSFIAALNTRRNLRGRDTEAMSNKLTSLPAITDQRSLQFPSPLTTLGDTAACAEAHTIEESIMPRFSEEWMKQQRPAYMAGW